MAELPEPEPQHNRAGTTEQARMAITLGSVRASLEEQPSANAIRATARRWIAAITAAAEDVIAERRHP
ncbi:hypothetical protein ABZZ36_18250 [Actinacidiphila glaucinigra]|uniref:hypothetical protein n=1 Tax=Actinacidiphila glaucinigra TaxID=235986 RepID=UPI0033B62FD8